MRLQLVTFAALVVVAAALPQTTQQNYLHVVRGDETALVQRGLAVYGGSKHGISAVVSAESVYSGAMLSVPYMPSESVYFFAEDDTVTAKQWSVIAGAAVQNKLELLYERKGVAFFRAPVDAKTRVGLTAAVAAAFPLTTEILTLATGPQRVIPSSSQQRLRNLLKTNTYRADVADLVSRVSQSSIQDYVRFLTGEDNASPLLSRNSYSEGGVVAGIWAASVFERDGFATQRTVFNDLYCPNVIAEKIGTTDPKKIVVVGAHLDDRATNLNDPAQPAPGANDDGSGSSMILEIARVIADANATFKYTLRLALFCGEEQGLVGSRAYARQLANDGEDIVAMLQGDMIGYQAGSLPELSFVNRYVDADLTAVVENITAQYVPNLRRSETSACCSDHQSFYEVGFPSAGFVEAGGYTIDPQYHREGDLSARSGYSFTQIQQIAQSVLASAAVLAGLN